MDFRTIRFGIPRRCGNTSIIYSLNESKIFLNPLFIIKDIHNMTNYISNGIDGKNIINYRNVDSDLNSRLRGRNFDAIIIDDSSSFNSLLLQDLYSAISSSPSFLFNKLLIILIN